MTTFENNDRETDEMTEAAPDFTVMPPADGAPDLSELAILTRHWGMAVKVAEQHYHRLLWITGLGWHVWDGRRWSLDPENRAAGRLVAATIRKAWTDAGRLEGNARKAAVKDIELCETASGTAGVLTLARSLEGMAVGIDQVDADPFLLNTAAGTLDLRTMNVRRPDPGDYLTKIATGGYRAGGMPAAPRWTAFLDRVVPDPEVRAYLARLLGYGLLGRVREHVMPIFTGTGQNGKSTLIEAIGNALGDYYAAVKPELLIASGSGHRSAGAANPDVMALRGRRVVSMVETEAGAKMDTSLVKNLTGGDKINARPLYRDPVEFYPTHLPIMVTNHLPEVPADDPALWRRLSVVPFDVQIPDAERDELLGEALATEADGILAWCVAGWTDYQARRHLDPPAAVGVRTAKYREESDLVGMWLADCCTLDPFNNYVTTTTTALWESWETWCKGNRRPSGRRPELMAALLRLDGLADKRVNNQRVITGITLVS